MCLECCDRPTCRQLRYAVQMEEKYGLIPDASLYDLLHRYHRQPIAEMTAVVHHRQLYQTQQVRQQHWSSQGWVPKLGMMQSLDQWIAWTRSYQLDTSLLNEYTSYEFLQAQPKQAPQASEESVTLVIQDNQAVCDTLGHKAGHGRRYGAAGIIGGILFFPLGLWWTVSDSWTECERCRAQLCGKTKCNKYSGGGKCELSRGHARNAAVSVVYVKHSDRV